MSRSPVELQIVEGIAVISLNGELGASNVQSLGRAYMKCLGSGPGRIVLNCERLYLMSSAILAVLMGSTHEIRERGGRILDFWPRSSLRSIFDRPGFSAIDFCGTLEEALDGFDYLKAVSAHT